MVADLEVRRRSKRRWLFQLCCAIKESGEELEGASAILGSPEPLEDDR